MDGPTLVVYVRDRECRCGEDVRHRFMRCCGRGECSSYGSSSSCQSWLLVAEPVSETWFLYLEKGARRCATWFLLYKLRTSTNIRASPHPPLAPRPPPPIPDHDTQEFNISINCKHLHSFMPSRKLYQQLVHYPQVTKAFPSPSKPVELLALCDFVDHLGSFGGGTPPRDGVAFSAGVWLSRPGH